MTPKGEITTNERTIPRLEDALELVKGWSPILSELIKLTPKGSLIDWQLKWRDPEPQWTSEQGRVIQLGDAAHTFLPTSGSGATQAAEDSFSLSTCLQIGGKANLKLACQIHNKLR
jgi:2-polyprenyl-6-methoxyphenol hydroxylase-like FAD-dependent oxidoreductase